jgi:hypothetical protein
MNFSPVEHYRFYIRTLYYAIFIANLVSEKKAQYEIVLNDY